MKESKQLSEILKKENIRWKTTVDEDDQHDKLENLILKQIDLKKKLKELEKEQNELVKSFGFESFEELKKEAMKHRRKSDKN